MTTVKEILVSAKEILLARGWCQGQMRDAEGHFCAVGALREAERREDYSPHQDHGALDAQIRSALLDAMGTASVAGYNDAHDRTLTEVIAKFDEAIGALP